MALCVYLLLWLLSTIHVSLAADDGGAQDPAPESDPAPVVTVGKAVTVKDELTVREGKDSKRLDPLQHLQDYETAGKLVDEHPQAVRIADKEITNPLGNFHVHLWAHLGSLPPAFCIPLEKEIPELPPKPLLKALEEVLSSLVNETAADPQIQEKVIEIIKPFEKFRNCCDKYFVFIDVKVPEFKPSEKSLYIWSKIPGHGVAGAPAVEPAAIEAPQEPAVEQPERAGDAASTPAPAEEPQEGGPQAGKEPKGDGKGDAEADAGGEGEKADKSPVEQPGEQPQGGEAQEPAVKGPEAGAGGDEPGEQPQGGGSDANEGGRAKDAGAPEQGQEQQDEQDQDQRKMADLKQLVTELYLCEQFQGHQFQDFPAFKDSGVGAEIDHDEFAQALQKSCHFGVKVDPEMSKRIFDTIDINPQDGKIKWKEWTEWREKEATEQAEAAKALRKDGDAA